MEQGWKLLQEIVKMVDILIAPHLLAVTEDQETPDQSPKLVQAIIKYLQNLFKLS